MIHTISKMIQKEVKVNKQIQKVNMLTELAITVLKGNPTLKEKISTALGVSEQAVNRYIRQNKPLGKLTTVGIVNLIASETQLTEEQILETEKTTA